MDQLTLTVTYEGPYWVGRCKELDLLTSGPEMWKVWSGLLAICRCQIQYAVENDRTEDLIRG